MLRDLEKRITAIKKAAGRWDNRLAELTDRDEPGLAGQLLEAAQRDFVRDDFWIDPVTCKTATFKHPEEALDYLVSQLDYCSIKIKEEWRPCACRNSLGDSFTNSSETKWRLREVSEALACLIDGLDGVAK